MKTFIDPNLLQRLRVGPLAAYLDAYLKHIEQQGFLPSSAPMQMYAIRTFDRPMVGTRISRNHSDLSGRQSRHQGRDPGEDNSY
jgi:hypothetical protein